MEALYIILGIASAVCVIVLIKEFHKAYKERELQKREHERTVEQQRARFRETSMRAQEAAERNQAEAIRSQRAAVRNNQIMTSKPAERRTPNGSSSRLKEVSTRRQDDLYDADEQAAIQVHQSLMNSLQSSYTPPDDSDSRRACDTGYSFGGDTSSSSSDTSSSSDSSSCSSSND